MRNRHGYSVTMNSANQHPQPAPTDDYEYARQFLQRVPKHWAFLSRIPVPFNVLETLAQAGDVEMRVEQPRRPEGSPKGSLHFFRRVR